MVRAELPDTALVVVEFDAEYSPSPVALVARTRYRYVVAAVKLESSNESPAMPPCMWVKFVQPAPAHRSSLYEAAPPVGAAQDTVSVVCVTELKEGVPGISGTVSTVLVADHSPSPPPLVARTA